MPLEDGIGKHPTSKINVNNLIYKMHFVYILSQDFEPYLKCSLKSLLYSGTTVKRVTILVVGGSIKYGFNVGCPIRVRVVNDIGNPLWMFNKTHICDVDSDSIVFLDTDTLVLGSMDEMLDIQKADVAARRATTPTLDSWARTKPQWEAYLKDHGASVYMPPLNAGLLVFRNGIHRRIKQDWLELMHSAYEGAIFGNENHADQWALPPALGRKGARFESLDRSQHAFAWEGDSAENAVVYHTGTPNFFYHAHRLREEAGLNDDSGIPVPSLRWHWFKERVRRKMQFL